MKNATEVLDQLRRRGARVSLVGGHLRITPRSLLDDELRKSIRQNRLDIIRLLEPNHFLNQLNQWPEEMQELISWFNSLVLPQGPIKINRWTTIVDPEKYRNCLFNDIARGPQGPRGRVIKEELVDLYLHLTKDKHIGSY